MKSFFKIILICLLFSCKSTQQLSLNLENVDLLISKLSWESFDVVTSYGTSLKIVDKNAVKIEAYGKEVSSKLISVLKDSEKTVIAHLILTRIWDPIVYQLNVRYPEDNSNNDELNYIEYSVNNLYWYKFINDNNRLSIDNAEKQKVYDYWLNRVSGCLNK